MARLAAVPEYIDGKGTYMLFIDHVFRKHELPLKIIYNPRFTSKFSTFIPRCLVHVGYVHSGSSFG